MGGLRFVTGTVCCVRCVLYSAASSAGVDEFAGRLTCTPHDFGHDFGAAESQPSVRSYIELHTQFL